MFYTVYRTTCSVSNKYYIGVHKTENPSDSYLGSGCVLHRSIKKHGRENFKKEILFCFDNPKDAFDKEEELVELHRKDPLCMNLRKGGAGGFDYVNASGLGNQRENAIKGTQTRIARLNSDPAFREAFFSAATAWTKTEEGKILLREYGRKNKTFLGKHHSLETKAVMSEKARLSSSGTRNSQYGTCWISKDGISKKVKKEELESWLNEEWVRGRHTRSSKTK